MPSPQSRWPVGKCLIGKWLGFVGMLAIYVAIMFGGTIAVVYWITGITPQNPILQGAILVFLECLIALSVTFMFGTWFSDAHQWRHRPRAAWTCLHGRMKLEPDEWIHGRI